VAGYGSATGRNGEPGFSASRRRQAQAAHGDGGRGLGSVRCDLRSRRAQAERGAAPNDVEKAKTYVKRIRDPICRAASMTDRCYRRPPEAEAERGEVRA
jgi:hypothetical protein